MRWREAIRKPLNAGRSLWRRGAEQAHTRRAVQFYGALVHEGDLCFDIGVNRGTRTALFRWLGARVVAVEPQADLAASIRSSFVGDPRVTVVEAGSKRGTLGRHLRSAA